MFTKCAHCKTLFRVHSEQLKAAQGLVRCAQCNEVFNALDHLHEHVDEAVTPAPVTVEEKQILPVMPVSAVTAQNDTVIDLESTDEPPLTRLEPDPVVHPPVSALMRLTTNLIWSMGILILVILAVVQTIWFNRDNLLKYDEGRRLVEAYCEMAGCVIPPRQALDKLKIIERLVASHPEAEDFLRIRITFENQAPFHQPFPILQVSLFTREGELQAQRRFSPAEYSEVPVDGILQPGQLVEIELDVKDPGPHVTGFEFAFF